MQTREILLQRTSGESVAHLIRDDQMVTKSMTSDMSRLDWDRQKDFYRLAKMGNAQCRRLFNDWAREQPAMARLLMADCESDARKSAMAKKSADKILAKAEKPNKPKKRDQYSLTKSLRPDNSLRASLEHTMRTSPDPRQRLAAEAALREM